MGKIALTFLDYGNCSNGSEFVNTSYNLSSEENVVPVAIHASFIALIILASVILNSLVLILVARNKQLRYQSIMVSLSIVVADYFMTIFYHFTSFLSLLVKSWAYENIESCQAFSALTLYLIYVRWAVLGVTAVDKFCNVRFPFRYSKHSKIILIILTVVAWVVPALFSLITVFPKEFSFRANIPMCIATCLTSDSSSFCTSHAITTFSLAFFWGGLLPSTLYTWMYYHGCKLKNTGKALGQLTIRVSAGVVVWQPMASIETHSRETRAFVTLVLLYLTNLFTSVPQYLLLLLRPINICVFFRIPIMVQFLVAEIFFLSVVLDPIMIMRNKDFRLAFKQMLLACRTQDNSTITSSPSNETEQSNNTTPTAL